MFAKTTNVGFAQRVVATLVACAVLAWSFGSYATAQAANLTNISDTLTDSDASVTSAHTIAFTVPDGSALAAGETITITFPVEFTDVNTVASGDLTVTADGAPATVGGFAVTATEISFNGVTASSGQEVVVAIADGKITNPAAIGSYEIVVATPSDTGKTRVAIIDNVLVTAIVETEFEFTIAGMATSSTVNGETTTGSSTATEIPFGVLTAGTPEALGQRLNVTSNARNGFVVTVQSDGDLESSTGAVIDNFVDGSDVAVPGTAWASPTNNIGDETTWGHWGLTANDSDLTTPFGASEFIAASTSPRVVFTHDGPSDGVTADIGQADVLYKIEITSLQEAGDDYNTTLTYIATPTF